MSARLLIAVVSTAVAFCVATPSRADDAERLRKAVAQLESRMWKVTKVVPGVDGVSGSILVTRFKGDSVFTESMWLGLGGDTPFTLNEKSTGVRVADIQEGMLVSFEFSGVMKTQPPKAIGITSVHVFGNAKAEQRIIPERLVKRAVPQPN